MRQPQVQPPSLLERLLYSSGVIPSQLDDVVDHDRDNSDE